MRGHALFTKIYATIEEMLLAITDFILGLKLSLLSTWQSTI